MIHRFNFRGDRYFCELFGRLGDQSVSIDIPRAKLFLWAVREDPESERLALDDHGLVWSIKENSCLHFYWLWPNYNKDGRTCPDFGRLYHGPTLNSLSSNPVARTSIVKIIMKEEK